MKPIIKKITALLVSMIMFFSMAPTVFAASGYSVEDAYEECAAQYPEFVDAIKQYGVTDSQIINFLAAVQEYLLNLDEEVTEENFEAYMIEAVNQTFLKRAHIKVRDALAKAFPGAVVDGMDGIIAPEFQPLMETIKSIIFDNGMLEDDTTEDENNDPETEPTTQPPTQAPTEEEPQKPTEEPTEEPTVAPTEAPTEKETGKNNGNTGNGNTVGGRDDDIDVTEPDTEPATQPTTQTPVFIDMNQAPWAEQAVKSLVGMGVINGYGDGTFKPNNPITRAEFAKIIVIASGRYSEKDKATYTSTFTDVPTTQWYYPYVSAALKFGFITGRSATVFDPDSNITRADLCLIVYRYIKSLNPEFKAKTDANGAVVTFADAALVPSYAQEAVNALYSNGIASLRDTANNKFEPTLNATRAECAVIVYNAINAALGRTVK